MATVRELSSAGATTMNVATSAATEYPTNVGTRPSPTTRAAAAATDAAARSGQTAPCPQRWATVWSATARSSPTPTT